VKLDADVIVGILISPEFFAVPRHLYLARLTLTVLTASKSLQLSKSLPLARGQWHPQSPSLD
jgi:hypothetical protein